MYCRSCGKEINDEAMLCVGCGVPVGKGRDYCQKCGAETHVDAEMCVKCGVRLTSASNHGKLEKNLGIPSVQVPEGVSGLNWGAFLLPVFWSLSHSVWIGLLCLIPYAGCIMSLVLLLKGNEWGWACRRFDNMQQFREVQRAWTKWGLIVYGVLIVGYGLIAGFALFMAQTTSSY